MLPRIVYKELGKWSRRVNRKQWMCSSSTEENKQVQWPKKIFSGVQPTAGTLHLGNYLGAIQRWVSLQNAGEDVTYCVVDLHSITLPQDPAALKQNTLNMLATLLACGIDPQKSTLFVQSTVKEHAELCWILSCLTTMARLSHLPQYKEKSAKLKEIPLGLFVYPVLQAADIMAYKATHVPVGEDQLQHLQLAQHLARVFNHKFGITFPHCHAIISDDPSARIKSLRDPTKKMSKSDPDPRSTILLTDSPDIILEKVKKAITDFTSAVQFDPEGRPGVANLITIHSLTSGTTPEEICEEAWGIDTGKYKSRVADSVIAYLTPIRQRLLELLKDEKYLNSIIKIGQEKASETADGTLREVKQKIGLANLSQNELLKAAKSL